MSKTDTGLCKHCNAPFTLRREWQKFCSTRCHHDFYATKGREARAYDKQFGTFHVYLMRMENTDLFKIGLSINPDRRRQDLEQNSPLNIKLIAEIRCGDYKRAKELEEQLLDATDDYKTKGEWVKLDFKKLVEITCDVLDTWEKEMLHIEVITAEQKDTDLKNKSPTSPKAL